MYRYNTLILILTNMHQVQNLHCYHYLHFVHSHRGRCVHLQLCFGLTSMHDKDKIIIMIVHVLSIYQ